MVTSEYYSSEELDDIGFKSVGEDVNLSKSCVIANPEDVVLGDRSRVDDFTIITGSVEIGSNVHIGAFCTLGGQSGIKISDFGGVSHRVAIFSSSDDYAKGTLSNPTVPEEYKSVISGQVIISKHCIIGSGSVILPDLTIGYATTVGALSLVNRSLDCQNVYAGIPVKLVSQREIKNIKDYENKYKQELE